MSYCLRNNKYVDLFLLILVAQTDNFLSPLKSFWRKKVISPVLMAPSSRMEAALQCQAAFQPNFRIIRNIQRLNKTELSQSE
jgi:hypothetical protein